MLRLGFAVKLLGEGAPAVPIGRQRTGLLSHWLVALYDVVRYLGRRQIRYYRLAVPEDLDVGMLQRELASCAGLLGELQSAIAALGLRLSAHAGHHIVLNSADTAVRARSAMQLGSYGLLLDALGCGAEGTVVIHASAEGGRRPALTRFAHAYAALPAPLRQRVVVEHDEGGCSLGDLIALHQSCGVAIVLDCLHLQLRNPEQLRLAEALGLAIATWPAGVPPEVHLSSPRTEGHVLAARGGQAQAVLPPRPGQHADFIAPADALALLKAGQGLPAFDIMIEAKAGDLALLRLRDDLGRLAPALAAKVR